MLNFRGAGSDGKDRKSHLEPHPKQGWQLSRPAYSWPLPIHSVESVNSAPAVLADDRKLVAEKHIKYPP